MTSLLGGVGSSPNLSGRLKPQPQSAAGDRASGRARGVGLRYRKWLWWWWLKPIEGERENGRGSREPAAARNPAAVRFPADSAPRVALPPAACQPRGFCLSPSCRPAASPPGRVLGRRQGRGKGRDEAQGGAAEGRGKAGCVWIGGGWSGGRLSQFNPEGVSFIYLFIKICHESHLHRPPRGEEEAGGE